MSIRLYSYFRSSCSWRVRIALALKGIEYEYVAVHLLNDGGEQFRDTYRQKNPMAQVPSLEIDGVTLGQSVAIIEYLEETRPTPALLPTSAAKRALVRQLTEVINAGIQPLQNLGVLIRLRESHGVGKPEGARWAAHFIDRGFQALEELLKRSAGRCCVGDQISIADLFLIPQVYNARRFQLDLSDYPTIQRLDQELSEHPAFIAAHPSNQPDCPPELR